MLLVLAFSDVGCYCIGCGLHWLWFALAVLVLCWLWFALAVVGVVLAVLVLC